MKKKKWMGLLICALSVCTAFPALAAGWELNGTDWYWRDRDGYIVYDTWKTGADGTWYYLGEVGRMEVNCLVDDEYYVDELGRMVKNEWKKLWDEDSEEERWYYFGANGKAYKAGNGDKATLKEINGQKYIFDDDCRMVYGWVNEDGSMVDEDDEDGWRDAVYYCGEADEGWVHKDWQQIEVEYEDDDDDTYTAKKWFYFKSNGKKAVDDTLRLKDKNGKEYKYAFDSNGAMISSKLITSSSSSSSKYYNKDGTLSKSKWIQRVPSKGQNEEDHDNDTMRWFYAQSNGNLVKDEIKKIDGKYYLFDKNGIMRAGIVAVKDGKYAYTLQNTSDDDEIWANKKDLVQAKENGYTIMYFDEKTGARKTGKFSVELNDDKYSLKFNSRGEALDGPHDGYLYEAGVLLKADEEKTQEFTVNGVTYTVDRNGKIKN